MAIFPEIEAMTSVHNIGHNLACGHLFLLKLLPLYSTRKGLSIHAKNSTLMKNPKWSLSI